MTFSKGIISKIDHFFLVFYLILSANAFVWLFASDGEDPLGVRESPLLVTLLIIIYTYFTGRVFSNFGYFIKVLCDSRFVVLLASYVFFTSLISEHLSFSLQKAIAFSLTCIAAAAISLLIPKRSFYYCLLISVFIVICASIFFGFFIKDFGVHQDQIHYGAWRGVFPQKQVLGQYCVFALIILITFKQEINSKLFFILLIFSFLLLVMSASRTAWVVSVLLLAINFYFDIHERIQKKFKKVMLVFLVCGATIVFYYIYVYFSDILDLLGKDETLTGRSTLWEYTLEIGSENRWFGVGYKAFWPIEADLILIYFGYYAVNGHNFILDSYLELGVIGLLIIFLFLCSFFLRAYANNGTYIGRLSLLMFFYIIFVGQVGTIFPNQNSLMTFMVLVLYFYGSKYEACVAK